MLGILILLVLTGTTLQAISVRNRLGFDLSDKIEYRRNPQSNRAEVFEPITLETVIVNHSRIPLFQLTLDEPLPQYAMLRSMHDAHGTSDSGQALSEPKNGTLEPERGGDLVLDEHRRVLGLIVRSDDYSLKSSVYLGGKQLLRRKTRISFTMRGTYRLDESKLLMGDFIGFTMQHLKTGNASEIVVYPAKLADAPLVDSTINYLGEIMRERTLFEDTLSTRGYRDYSSSDPMKNISWKQSARTGRLIVREFDRLSDAAVTIVLDLSYLFDGDRDNYIRLLEFCYSACRTIIEILTERGESFVFTTNAHTPDRKTVYSVTPGRTQLSELLELLARTKSMARISTYRLLKDIETPIIYIGLKRTAESEGRLDALRMEKHIRSHRIYAEEHVDSDPQAKEREEAR